MDKLFDLQKELDVLLEPGEVTLIFSQELLEEFLQVSERPKFKRFFKKSQPVPLKREPYNITLDTACLCPKISGRVQVK